MALLSAGSIMFYYNFVPYPSYEIHANDSTTGTGVMQLRAEDACDPGWGLNTTCIDYVAMCSYSADVSNVVGAEGYCGPIISGVTPSTAVEGESKTLTVVGYNFESGAAVTLEKTGETDITATDVAVDLDGEGLTCDVDTTGEASGWWDMRIVNP
jgi:hypothetical protein